MNNRIKQFQESLVRKNIAAVVLRLPENLLLFTGHWTQNGISFLFIPAIGEACLAVPEGEIVGGVEIEQIKYFGWARIYDRSPYENMYRILEELNKKNFVKKHIKIGVEIGNESIAPPLCSSEILLPGIDTLKAVKKAFNTNNLISVNEIINEIKSIKSEKDIFKLNQCNSIAYKGIKYFRELVSAKNSYKKFLREIDLASDVEAYIAKIAQNIKGVKYCRAWAQVSSGIKTADAWFPGMVSSSNTLKDGGFVMMELATVVDGYWSDLTDTIVFGKATYKQEEMIRLVKEARNQALDAIYDGITGGEIDDIVRGYLNKEGYGKYFIHITGHGTGFSYHEPFPVIGPNSKHMLRKGMVHSIEPGIYIPGFGGVRFESDILVTKSDCLILGQ